MKHNWFVESKNKVEYKNTVKYISGEIPVEWKKDQWINPSLEGSAWEFDEASGQ